MREITPVAAVAIAALFAMVGAASAADVDASPYDKTPAYFVPPYDWSGGYVGLNVGYGLGRTSDKAVLDAPGLFADSRRLNANGVVGGGQIGYNLQVQKWVVGLEADLQGAEQISSHTFTCPAGVCSSVALNLFGQVFNFPGPAVTATASQRLELFGTIRGRAGVAVVPEVLLYATGGFAYGQVDTNTTLAGAIRQQNFVPGWAIGAGLEGAVGRGWTVRLEYLYLCLPNVTGVFRSNVLGPGGAANLVENFNSRVTDNVVRIGLNYAFSGPVIAKY